MQSTDPLSVRTFTFCTSLSRGVSRFRVLPSPARDSVPWHTYARRFVRPNVHRIKYYPRPKEILYGSAHTRDALCARNHTADHDERRWTPAPPWASGSVARDGIRNRRLSFPCQGKKALSRRPFLSRYDPGADCQRDRSAPRRHCLGRRKAAVGGSCVYRSPRETLGITAHTKRNGRAPPSRDLSPESACRFLAERDLINPSTPSSRIVWAKVD